MHRLQISLTDTQYEFLKSESFVTGKSMAALLREFLNEIMEARRQAMLNDDPIWQVIGVAQDVEGPTDVSENVDKYLYGIPLESSSQKKVAEESDEYSTD